MLRSSYSRTALLAIGFLVILYLASVAEAQSHNDKFYQILKIPKDAAPRQIKKVRGWKASFFRPLPFFGLFRHFIPVILRQIFAFV